MAKQSQWPEVRDISVADLIDIMAAGLRDFRAAPKYGLVVGGVFALGGWLLLIMLWKLGLIYLSYPVAMGFALIAPFAAVGFYAVSERLESGKPLSWGALWGAIRGSTQRDLRWMALITGFAFFIWVDMAAMLFMVFIGFNALDGNFFNTLFGTTEGWMFLIVGNFAGAVLAMIVFSISVVSFPMLFDRDVDFVTAMVTSVRLVIANPKSMVIWCIIIAVLTGLALMSVFVGLVVVLPVIGHATWHLYRRAVEPAAASALDQPALYQNR